VVHGVVHGQGVHLDEADVEGGVGEELELAVHQVLAHGEDADLDVGALGLLEELVAPLDVVQREGDLLDGLEAHDLGDLALLDGRQLDEAGEARLAADPDRDLAALGQVALDEVGQRVLDELLAVVAGLGEHGLVLDDVEVVDAEALGLADELDGLEGPVADVDAPGEAGGSHGCRSSLEPPESGGRITRAKDARVVAAEAPRRVGWRRRVG